MCDNNGKKFVATLFNVLLAPDLCDRLFSTITLMNAGHTCLFHKGFCTVYFGAKCPKPPKDSEKRRKSEKSM